MNRRDFIKCATLTAASPLLSFSSVPFTAQATPNIILIMADDFGYELPGVNGGIYSTPNLDQLAAGGMRFEHCHAMPLCSPSRQQMMTGVYNIRNYVNWGMLDTGQTTFAQLIRNAGYKTCIAGKWQLNKDRNIVNHFGFDEYCLWFLEHWDSRYNNVGELIQNGEVLPGGQGEYGPDIIFNFALDFITRHQGEPFLLYYPMVLTHDPFEPTPDSIDQTQTDIYINFADMVTYMDKLIGQLVDHLDMLGIRDNTLIIFTGDNGTDTRMGGAKRETIDAGTKVPLIINWPGVTPAGAICDDLIDFSDFLPTICQVAGVNIPSVIDGQSFFPQIIGNAGNPRQWSYSWYSRNGDNTTPIEWARTKDYKLYSSGEFYNVEIDALEQSPLVSLNSEQQQIKILLQGALNKYQDTRLELIRDRVFLPYIINH